MESAPLNVVATTSKTDMEEKSTNTGRIIGLAICGLIERSPDDSDIVLTLIDFLEQGGTSQLRSIASAGNHDPDFQNKLVEICKPLASYFDKRRSETSEIRLEGGNALLSDTASKYKAHPELVKQFSNWSKARKELIEISKSTAERLDQQYYFVNIARIIGSFVEICNSLNWGIYHKFCFSVGYYADNISPKLGIITKSALQLAPYLRYIGFVNSFFDILESQVAIKRVVNIIKNDEEMFEPLKDWLDETKKLNDTVKKLLPYQINEELIKSIDDALKELGEEQKIFSAAILSSIMKDPWILKDEKFMNDAFRFCSSDAAIGWYNRMINGGCPSQLDRDLMNLQEELQKMERADADVASKVENCKNMVEAATNDNVKSNFGRYAIFMMGGMSIYCCLGNIRAGSKHIYSDRLRKISRKAQSFLNIMEQIDFSKQ